MGITFYEDLINDLKSGGFRLTKVRKALIKELDLAQKPLSAAELMSRLEGHGLHPHKTSIYREIGFLLDRGIIKKLTFGERQDRFELTAIAHHHHAVCERCGEVEDVGCGDEIRRIEMELKQKGFSVNAHLVEFFGLCGKCQGVKP